MSLWKQSTYGSNQTLDLGVLSIAVIYRSGTKETPIPDNERYEFRIGTGVSTKKFASAEEAKRIAISSARNKLTAALEILKQAEGK